MRRNIPNSSLFGSGEVINGPGVASRENRVEADTSNVYCKVANCDVVFDGFCFGEQNGICDDEKSLSAGDKGHTPCESVGK